MQHLSTKSEETVLQYPFQMIESNLLNWNGQDFVLVVDYYNRYWDIEKLHKTDTATVITKLLL